MFELNEKKKFLITISHCTSKGKWNWCWETSIPNNGRAGWNWSVWNTVVVLLT